MVVILRNGLVARFASEKGDFAWKHLLTKLGLHGFLRIIKGFADAAAA
jgi:hypothetical protein